MQPHFDHALRKFAGALLAGGAAGNALATRMKITDLPQMVAAFHSLVGLAAVTTSVANYMGHDPAVAMDSVHLVATYLGTWIGAVTLTGTRQSVSQNVLPSSGSCECSSCCSSRL